MRSNHSCCKSTPAGTLVISTLSWAYDVRKLSSACSMRWGRTSRPQTRMCLNHCTKSAADDLQRRTCLDQRRRRENQRDRETEKKPFTFSKKSRPLIHLEAGSCNLLEQMSPTCSYCNPLEQRNRPLCCASMSPYKP